MDCSTIVDVPAGIALPLKTALAPKFGLGCDGRYQKLAAGIF